MKSSRRHFLAGAGAAVASAVAGSAYAQNVIDSILRAPRRGVWNDQFDAGVSSAQRVSSNQAILNPINIGYVQNAIAQYSQIVANGGWPMVPPENKLQIGVVHPDVEILRRRLMISGDLSPQAGMSPAFDTYVEAALRRFQARHGLPADGVTGRYTYSAMNVSAEVRLGQLQTNLQRLMDWTARDLGHRFVMVNIPAAQIQAVEGGRVALNHTAVVGKVDRQTPILSSKINEIILNPYWNAPVSIVKKDIIPVMRKNPNYLRDNNIRLIAPDGREVDPMTIDWSTDEAAKYRFRQDPGKINAMASVKINFPNPHAVYMHDTPEQHIFRDQERFHSSGCVRVQNVRDLVTWILRDTPGWDRRTIERTIQTEVDKHIPVADPVPVHFVYISSWATGDGVVHFRDDIYGFDGARELQMSSTL
ncbi:L,D-transpeptidase family protein [Chelativorans composti]|jgi:Uncharacterized protein conserved in bacteria|uniref:Murein L,D-transpeptidase n=1 Tax=Chelativorans composti TaxID=768533 RepID=A0ABW5DG06_9HYPH|nr:L,D-transpeptidase family protein [bacterium SGD-2]